MPKTLHIIVLLTLCFFSSVFILQADSPTALFYDDVIREEKLKDIANKITNLSTQEKERKNRWTMSDVQLVDETFETPTRDDINNNNNTSSNGNCKQKRPQSLSIVSSTPSIISVVKKKLPASSPTTEIINYRKTSAQQQQESHERGDPDGDCGMEDSTTSYCSKTAELRVKLPSEEILNSKSGWLMKQDHQDWSKYWFSLKGGGLFYYRDPSAEERGVLDGVLDVNSITSIKEITSNRNHAFQLTVILLFFNNFIISLFDIKVRKSKTARWERRPIAHDEAILFNRLELRDGIFSLSCSDNFLGCF